MIEPSLSTSAGYRFRAGPSETITSKLVAKKTITKTRANGSLDIDEQFDVTKHGKSITVESNSSGMWDMVIPNFKARSAKGEIFNNAMKRTTESFVNPAVAASCYNDYTSSGRPARMLHECTMQFPLPDFSISQEDASLAYSAAITDAYAGITANEGATALWLGESRETVKMLFDIGKGVKALFDMTKKQRENWRKGKLSVEGQQSLTLAILYGILPLEQQIAQFTEGLFNIKEHGLRETSRGFRPYNRTSTTESIDVAYGGNNVRYDLRRDISETINVKIRAGCLYEVDLSNQPPFLSVIFDPKQVISTAYALARLSFVMDWFINVGSTLAAWSPSVGTNVLSAWVSVEVTQELKVRNTIDIQSTYTGGTGNRVDCSRSRHVKWRVPINRSDLAVFPRLDINLNMSKILSMVLLFAKVKKTI